MFGASRCVASSYLVSLRRQSRNSRNSKDFASAAIFFGGGGAGAGATDGLHWVSAKGLRGT